METTSASQSYQNVEPELLDAIFKTLRSLPAIYHDGAETPNSPLQALLYVIEENFWKIEDLIDHIDRYFDIGRTPSGAQEKEPDFLSWLATWVGLELDENWPESKKRYALKNAVTLQQYRGTVTGLCYMLALYFNIDAQVIEWTWPNAMQVGVRNSIGVDTQLFEKPDLSHCFVLIWSPAPEEREQNFSTRVRKIRAMIDQEKPSHSLCFFHIAD